MPKHNYFGSGQSGPTFHVLVLVPAKPELEMGFHRISVRNLPAFVLSKKSFHSKSVHLDTNNILCYNTAEEKLILRP